MIILTPELAQKWTRPNDTTLVSLDGETEVGDAQQPTFFPQVKMKRAGNKANSSLRLALPSFVPDELYSDFNSVVFRKGGLTMRFSSYLDKFSMDIALQSPPDGNYLDFTLQIKEAKLRTIAPLSAEKLATGSSNSGKFEQEKTNGSIVVFSNERGNAFKDGFLCHYFNPEITDQTGTISWGMWGIIEPLRLRLNLPPGLTYPIVIH